MGTPLVSIAILTKNGGDAFVAVLDAIRRQQCDLSHHVVILDSGSTDGTLQAARDAGAIVHEIPPEDFSFGKSRDLLFSHCEGDIVVTISQDALPVGTAWLELLVRPIREGRADVVQGWEKMEEKPFYWDRIGRFYGTSEWIPFLERYGRLGISTVNLAVSRQAWKRTGFGPIPMCSDKLFQKRVAEAGLRVVVCREALVQHGHRYDTGQLFKRCANEGMALRLLGFRVGTAQAVRDLLSPRNHRDLLRGLARGGVRTAAEVLFPILRPVGVWYGNRYLTGYWR